MAMSEQELRGKFVLILDDISKAHDLFKRAATGLHNVARAAQDDAVHIAQERAVIESAKRYRLEYLRSGALGYEWLAYDNAQSNLLAAVRALTGDHLDLLEGDDGEQE